MAKDNRALPYVFSESTSAAADPVPPPATDVSDDVLSIPVDDLELSIRTANGLQNASVEYIGQLVQMTEDDLLRTKNLGRKSIAELNELLVDLGLRLGMSVVWRPPAQ